MTEDFLRMLNAAVENPDRFARDLTDWERKFVRSMEEFRGKSLSDAQERICVQIADKLEGRKA